MSYAGFVPTGFIDIEQKYTFVINLFGFNCNYAGKLALGALKVLIISGV